ncbi:NDR1/HIN1-like protein 13 [Typha angustifolia]|uniref:NDR1/HIN1-like protein 13 n=1 Tax=Typha angustifolia TaxID=59011 RepID=UPI003C309334
MIPERVHPSDLGTSSSSSPPPATAKETTATHPSFQEKPKLPPGTYVIQVPKDQIYRVPPPENAKKFKSYTRRATRRRGRGCCCCLLFSLSALLLSLAIVAGALYFAFRPKPISFSLDSIAIRNLNLSSSASSPLNPEFNATIRSDNPNKRIGFRFRDGGSVNVFYGGVALGNGAWPAFYQGPRNVTVFAMSLTGSGIRLSAAERDGMVAAEGRGGVPLQVAARVPVRVRFGAVTTWTITVKVGCDVTVDKLTTNARILSKKCKVKVRII